MDRRLHFSLRGGGEDRGRSARARVQLRVPFTIAGVDRVHNDAARLLDFEELMERIVALRGARLDAGSAQVIVCSGN